MTGPKDTAKTTAKDTAKDTGSSEHEGAHARLLPQIGMIVRALLASPVGRTLLILAVTLLVVIIGTAYGQIRLNRWNRPFYDAISRRDMFAFLMQLGVFCIIAGSLLVLNVIQCWLQEMFTLKLREGLVGDLLRDWMKPRRALLLANAGPIGVNPDQRMHEDARRLCELSTTLFSGLMQSSILLVTFVGVLWVLSRGFALHIGPRDYPLPGYMVWAAILYAGLGSLLSYRVGRTLIPRNAERYAREADLRFSLVRVNEHLDGISLAHGEAGEMRRVELHLSDVLKAMRRLVSGLTNLTWITAGFGWITNVAPILVAAPLYFEGTLSFGGLMMAAAAFQQAQSSLNWFVNNFSTIADWRAILIRVATFRRALITADTAGPQESRIEYLDGPPGRMHIESLEVAGAVDRDMLEESNVEIRAGERLLILAEPGTGKTRLFRALAGLWPWGSGRITRPGGQQVLYLPRGTPYLPRGSLREVLAYPASLEDFTSDAYAEALRRMGLERLVPVLDETHRWDHELSQEEQLSLAFARIALHRPPWLVIDDTLGSLDGETLERVIDLFADELAATTIIHIGTAMARDPLFSRVVRLVKPSSSARVLRPIALMLALALLLPAVLLPTAARAAASEQMFQFRAPPALNGAATTQVMRDLAERVLPVYSDPDRIQYLTNLSALQMIAGDYTAAYETRQMLRARLGGSSSAQAPEQSVVYDIYAHTEALLGPRVPYGLAFSRSFQQVVPHLDNLTDYAVTSWLDTPLSVFQDRLNAAFASVRARRSITLPEALQVTWAYLAYQLHLATGPQADELINADLQSRYITEDHVSIRTAGGVRLSAMLVRPRAATGKLPTLLEFTIYVYPENYALECAAHGYVGVVAYSRGKRDSRGAVAPYEHDGADAREVIDWISKQPWSDGRVGMYGSGYSAFAAWAAAKHPPRALRAIATASSIAPGIDAPDRNTVFLNSSYRWARYVTGTRMLNDEADQDEAHWLALNRTWYQSGRPYEDLPKIDGTPNPSFTQWLHHPSYDRYWQAMIPYDMDFAHIDIPVLAMSGYYDLNEPGTLYYFQQHQHFNPHADQTLLIGPFDDSVVIGMPNPDLQGYRLDDAARMDWHELRYDWFDAIFKGTQRPPLLRPGVDYEVMGGDEWRQTDAVDDMASRALRLYLDPSPSDSDSENTHLLADLAPLRPSFIDQTVNFADRSDANWLPSTALESDNLPTHESMVFATAPLRQTTEFDGLMSGQLTFTTNKPDFDFTLALFEEMSDGRYLKLYDPPDEFRASYLADRSTRHLLQTAPTQQQLAFRSEHLLARRLAAGSRLVLVLSIVKRPDQEINYGTAAAVATESIADAKEPLRIRWFANSYIDLPVQGLPPVAAVTSP
ncbi:MAG TPA: CocE/NonD family hydrolase [Steroidobacteraceae bacterium]|nr:CocE/NonD family hydrolase [Steroidobacteraceae bacterium]